MPSFDYRCVKGHVTTIDFKQRDEYPKEVICSERYCGRPAHRLMPRVANHFHPTKSSQGRLL